MLLSYSRAGFVLFLDDFGTDSSSCSYLEPFLCDSIQIERSRVTSVYAADAGRRPLLALMLIGGGTPLLASL